MKKSLLSAFFVGLLYCSYCQPYQKFVVEGAHWEMNESYCYNFDPIGSPYPYRSTTYWFKLEGDTLIDTVAYKKLHHSWHSIFHPPFPSPPQSSGFIWTLIGFVKEDTINRKVYIRANDIFLFPDNWCPSISLTDALWFDFSDTIQDSISVNYKPSHVGLSCRSDNLLVDTIYNYVNYGHLRKTWFMSPPAQYNLSEFRMIEGIGYSFGLFGGPGPSFEGCYRTNLISYCVGNDSTCGEGYIPVGIKNINKVESFLLSPNPASTQFTITIDEALLNSTATITDMTGSVVAAVQLTTRQSPLATHHLPNGVYFITIQTTQRTTVTKKLIVSR